MAQIKEQYEYKIPAWALPSLINGDESGLQDDDIERIKDFEARLKEHMKECNGSSYVIDYGEGEAYFSRTNAFNNIGDNVIDCTINIF